MPGRRSYGSAPTGRGFTSTRAMRWLSARSPSTTCPTTFRSPCVRSTSTTNAACGWAPRRRIIAHPQLLRQKDLRRSPCRTENHGQQRSAGQLGLHFRRKQPQPAVDRHRRRRAELLLLCRPKDPPPRRPRGDAVHPHAARDGAGHPVGGFGRLRYIPHHARRIADPS